MKNLPVVQVALFITACCFTVLIGCATLQPGADPLVVRAEQLETAATASFDLVVNLDDANRTFWRTNAPAFHNFSEWLRTPIVVGPGTNTMRRGLAMISQVDAAKLQYKASTSQSNVLLTAITILSSAIDQSTAWATIVKTPIPIH